MKLKAGLFGLAFSLALSSAALANNGPGYADNPGRQQAIAVGAQCGSGAASGAFGAFGGHDNNFAGGANGPATGEANSAVCGNRPATAGPSLLDLFLAFFGFNI